MVYIVILKKRHFYVQPLYFFKDISSGQTWILNKFYIKENCIIQCRYICYSIKLIFLEHFY